MLPASIPPSPLADGGEIMRPTLALAAAPPLAAPARGAGEARARHLHLRELRLGMGPGPGDRRELRGGLRLHACASSAPATARRCSGGCGSRASARPADIVLGLDTNLTAEAKATGPLRAARDRGAGARPADPLGRRHLPALRLGLLRLRLRQDEDARPAEELRGADRVGRQHRHPRPAQLDAGPRPADVGQGRLRRPGAGDLEGPARRTSSPSRPAGPRPTASSSTARSTWRSPTPPRPPTT